MVVDEVCEWHLAGRCRLSECSGYLGSGVVKRCGCDESLGEVGEALHGGCIGAGGEALHDGCIGAGGEGLTESLEKDIL